MEWSDPQMPTGFFQGAASMLVAQMEHMRNANAVREGVEQANAGLRQDIQQLVQLQQMQLAMQAQQAQNERLAYLEQVKAGAYTAMGRPPSSLTVDERMELGLAQMQRDPSSVKNLFDLDINKKNERRRNRDPQLIAQGNVNSTQIVNATQSKVIEATGGNEKIHYHKAQEIKPGPGETYEDLIRRGDLKEFDIPTKIEDLNKVYGNGVMQAQYMKGARAFLNDYENASPALKQLAYDLSVYVNNYNMSNFIKRGLTRTNYLDIDWRGILQEPGSPLYLHDLKTTISLTEDNFHIMGFPQMSQKAYGFIQRNVLDQNSISGPYQYKATEADIEMSR